MRVISRDRVTGNARLTASTGLVLLVLLAAEGVTILSIRRLLLPHVFIGLLLIPPVLLKLASTGLRAVRYYLGDPDFRAAGPPPPALRLLGGCLAVATVAVVASGLELWLFGLRLGAVWITIHQLSFVAWLLITGAHVLAYLGPAQQLALDDLRPARRLPGASRRRALLVASLLLGAVVAISMLPWQSPFLISPG